MAPLKLAKNVRKRAPGVRALQEIKHYQKFHHPLLLRAPFIQVIRELIACDPVHRANDGMFQLSALGLGAPKEAAEPILVVWFELLQLSCEHRGCKTIDLKETCESFDDLKKLTGSIMPSDEARAALEPEIARFVR